MSFDPSKINMGGYLRDYEDERDFIYKAPPTLKVLPTAVYLSTAPVLDQLQLPWCVHNGICLQMSIVEVHDLIPTFKPHSRRYLAYKYQASTGNLSEPDGAYPRTALNIARKIGVCHEVNWPYTEVNPLAKPPDALNAEAANNQILQYLYVKNLTGFLGAIASGYPVGFGFSVLTSFMSDQTANTGIWPGRQSGDANEGGHYVVAVGYNRNMAIGQYKGAALIQNSWGTDWGCQPGAFNSRGFVWMPLDWLMKNASDMQVVQKIEE